MWSFFLDYYMVIIGGVLVVCGLWIASDWDWGFWSEQTLSPDGEVKEIRTDRLKIIQQVLLMIGGVLALGFGAWRTVTAHRQANAALDQARTAIRQASLAERSHNVDRYAKAAGLLDTDKIVVRQAGIYALRELGQVDPAGSGRVCIQLLSGFVRDRSHEFLKEARHEEFQAPEDLVDAIRAIGLINHVLRSQNIIAGINLVRIVATGASLGDLDLFSATFNNAFLDRASAHGGSWRQTFFGDTAMKGWSNGRGFFRSHFRWRNEPHGCPLH